VVCTFSVGTYTPLAANTDEGSAGDSHRLAVLGCVREQRTLPIGYELLLLIRWAFSAFSADLRLLTSRYPVQSQNPSFRCERSILAGACAGVTLWLARK